MNDIFFNKECCYINLDDLCTRNGNLLDKFSILHININSLAANFNSLLCFLTKINFNFAIIVITETKLDSSCDSLYGIDGYNNISINRNRHGGGIRLYYLRSVSIEIVSEMTGIFESCEMLVSRVILNNIKPILIYCIYRPPICNKRKFYDFITENIENVSLCDIDKILIGDFNIDLNENLSINRDFYDLLSSKSFKLCITLPTYVPYNRNFPISILDQIAINSVIPTESLIIDSKLSDHLPIALFYRVPSPIAPPSINCQ